MTHRKREVANAPAGQRSQFAAVRAMMFVPEIWARAGVMSRGASAHRVGIDQWKAAKGVIDAWKWRAAQVALYCAQAVAPIAYPCSGWKTKALSLEESFDWLLEGLKGFAEVGYVDDDVPRNLHHSLIFFVTLYPRVM